MIYRYLFAFILLYLLCIGSTKAQQAPDMVAIKDSIANPASRFYYPDLMARYQQMDSTLTLDDYHYLYYGYGEQVSYMPLIDNTAETELSQLLSGRSTPKVEHYFRAIALCKAILEIEPFNLRDINALSFIYTQIGHTDKSEQLIKRLRMIAQTIMATGTGLKEESPWWIIYFDHATDLLNMYNFAQQQPIIVSRTVEFIPVSNMAQKGDKGYYFNFSEIYARKPDYLEGVQKPKRKMNLKLWEPATTFKL